LQVASGIFETLAPDLSESVKKAIFPSEQENVGRVIQEYVLVLKAVLKSGKSATAPEFATVEDEISEDTKPVILDIDGLERVATWLLWYHDSILDPVATFNDLKSLTDLKKGLSQVASKVCKTFGLPLIVLP
jgi:hypothetical protein